MTEFVDPNKNREGYEFNMDSQRWEPVAPREEDNKKTPSSDLQS